MSEVDLEFEGQVSDDLVKAAQEANLIDTGRYKAQLEGKTYVKPDMEFFDKEEKNRNPLFGHTVGVLQFRLSSAREEGKRDGAWEAMESPRVWTLRVCPDTVMTEKGKLHGASEAFGHLAGVAKKANGHSMSNKEVIDWLADNMIEVNIGMSEESTKNGVTYQARNWFRGARILE